MKLREKLKYSGPGVRTRVSGGARGLDGGVHRSRKEGAPCPVVAGESVFGPHYLRPIPPKGQAVYTISRSAFVRTAPQSQRLTPRILLPTSRIDSRAPRGQIGICLEPGSWALYDKRLTHLISVTFCRTNAFTVSSTRVNFGQLFILRVVFDQHQTIS